MALARAFMRNPGGRALLVVGIFLLVFELWIALTAPQKIDPAVLAAAQNEGSANVVVELYFPPESYHFLFLQDYGRISGSSDEGVRLRRVSLENLQALSRAYWIKGIKPLE